MNEANKTVTINSRKYDGTIHKSWQAILLARNDSLITFVGVFQKEVNHSHLGFIRRGTVSYEFYWLNEWFSIFRFHEPDGALRNFYCNVNMPPAFSGDAMDYIDLDIDVVVWKDFTAEILDLEEFEENSLKYKYTPEIKNRVKESLDTIFNLVKNRSFPFDMKLQM